MSLLEAAIGWLAPATCINCGAEGSSLCPRCSSVAVKPFGARCWRCNRISRNSKTCETCIRYGSPKFVWIVTDYSGTTRNLISIYKFGHQRAAGTAISKLMLDTYINLNPEISKNYLIVPVPTATARVRERGFDHTELIADSLALSLHLDGHSSLRRLGQTRQLGAKREDRLKQLKDSFVVKNPSRVAGRDILLIDDVVTTGGTIIAATQALRAAGAKRVDALLFAKRL